VLCSARKQKNSLVLQMPDFVLAGVEFSFTITAYDTRGVIDTTFNGKVELDPSDPLASLPSAVTIKPPENAGQAVFQATFRTLGKQMINAHDSGKHCWFSGSGSPGNTAADGLGNLRHPRGRGDNPFLDAGGINVAGLGVPDIPVEGGSRICPDSVGSRLHFLLP